MSELLLFNYHLHYFAINCSFIMYSDRVELLSHVHHPAVRLIQSRASTAWNSPSISGPAMLSTPAASVERYWKAHSAFVIYRLFYAILNKLKSLLCPTVLSLKLISLKEFTHTYPWWIQLCGEYLKSYGLFMSFRKCVFRLCDFCDS